MRNKFKVGEKLEEIGLQNCCISEITVAELLYGAIWSGCINNLRHTKNFCKYIEVIPIAGTLLEFANQKSILRKLFFRTTGNGHVLYGMARIAIPFGSCLLAILEFADCFAIVEQIP